MTNPTAAASRTATPPVGPAPELLSFPASIALAEHDLVLRHLQANDGDAIVRFARSLPADDLLFLRRDITDPGDVESWIAEAMSGDAPTIVALNADRVIGYVLLATERVRWARHVAEIRMMVGHGWRGRGLGGLLLSQAVALGLELGFRKLIAQMTFDQAGAFAAFSRFGFAHEATLPDRVIDRDGRLRALRVMGLDTAAFEVPSSELIVAARSSAAGTYRWRGSAELLDVNGIVVAEVEATLWKHDIEGRGPRWGGELIALASIGLQWAAADETPELRLSDGGCGQIASIGTVRMNASGGDAVHRAQLSGQGEPPF